MSCHAHRADPGNGAVHTLFNRWQFSSAAQLVPYGLALGLPDEGSPATVTLLSAAPSLVLSPLSRGLRRCQPALKPSEIPTLVFHVKPVASFSLAI